MDIINLTKISGAYQMQSWPDNLAVPDGHAIVPDGLDRTMFYAHNGFVVLTLANEERVVGNHEEFHVDVDGNEIVNVVDDTATFAVVMTWEPDTEAWEAWEASRPEPVELEPTSDDVLNVLLGVTE